MSEVSLTEKVCKTFIFIFFLCIVLLVRLWVKHCIA